MNEKYSITFGGDTSLGDYYLRKFEKDKSPLLRLSNDPASFFEGVKPLVENSTHLILNFESVLAENPKKVYKSKQYPNYDNPKRTLEVLNGLGVTAVNLANNHSNDFGSEIMLNTVQQLNDAGINSFGVGANILEASKPLRIQLMGGETTKSVYILAGLLASQRYWKDYSFSAEQEKPGVCPFKIKSIKKRITNLRSEDPTAIIVVCPHWQGYDYKRVPQKIKKICRELIDAGANYVLAHGTHMINPLEKRGEGIIAYSIGNFIFNSPGRYQKYKAPPYSFIVRLEIEERNGKWDIKERFYPIQSDPRRTGYNNRPVNESEAEEIQQILIEKSNTQHQNVFSIKKDSRGFYFV
ncbi:CapA family protein [Peribacillus deserti]|uniref:Capsule synthesis protein CapA domain-containing protein n=1 Tax=Peribacillus deserti TaxID=673318 RepID=A0A2N5M091_9BACI|nr:CapA family protein [Peribacillus deserti]PLT27784.1 hypothetical protein CUU66_21985 [Peribacillus deserti]